MSSVYEPREDSELLASCVLDYALGDVLDMGTGSGIQAMTAIGLSAVTSVLAVDKNPVAVELVLQKKLSLSASQQSKLSVLESDMFSAIPSNKRFDTIVCNPPYLPLADDDADPALYGGLEGHEWSILFLSQAKSYLSPDGKMLFLFSSLTGQDRIDLELHRLGYAHELIAQTSFFFERLYVYLITVKS